MKLSVLLASASFALLAVTASVAPVQAQRWEDCRERVHQAEWRLDRAVERYGRRSPEARDARHDLERVRDWCYAHHRSDWDRGYRDGDRRDDPPPRRHHW